MFYHSLARQLTALGSRVHVVAYQSNADRSHYDVEDGVATTRIAMPSLQGRSRLTQPVARARALSAATARVAAEFSPQWSRRTIGRLAVARAGAAALVRLHGAGKRLAHARGERPPRMMRLLERRMAAKATGTIAVSEWVLRQSQKVLSLHPGRAVVIPNGVDTELFRPGGKPRREEIVLQDPCA
ncbi:MAG: glycosyltransferase family 4 protein [Bryobacterales bacterium]